MKRIRAAVFSLTSVFLVGSVLAGCDWSFGYKDAELSDGFDVYYNSSSKLAFAATATWDGDESGTTYTIPDSYSDCQVNALGGFFGRGVPCTFGIIVAYDGPNPMPESEKPDNFVAMEADSIPTNSDIHIYSFFVKIGAALSTVNLASDYICCAEQADGSYFVSRSSVFFDVDSANSVFYSKDGIIYNHSDDSVALNWIIEQAEA